MFYFDKIKNKKILKSDLLKNLKHCFTTRETVIKSAEINISELIENNKIDICNYFAVSQNDLICPTQTHSSNIQIAQIGQTDYPDTDAIILTNKKQAVYLNFADCTPIIIYDEIKNICAVVHAGWRGTADKIVQKTIQKMIDIGSNPSNIVAAIGPTIGKCCFCIGDDVKTKLNSTIPTKHSVFTEKNEKIYADLKMINYLQLLSTGVKKIDLCDYCTSCSTELFFSYRKENSTTSRHSAIVKLV